MDPATDSLVLQAVSAARDFAWCGLKRVSALLCGLHLGGRMHINKVVVENYRCLRKATVSLNHHLNILVGNNECGKSTFLEAIHLALSGHLNGRPVQLELHPYLFNAGAVKAYIDGVVSGQQAAPPSNLNELYLADDPELTKQKRTSNSIK
jgi:AAA15 family ATPase/GTPase